MFLTFWVSDHGLAFLFGVLGVGGLLFLISFGGVFGSVMANVASWLVHCVGEVGCCVQLVVGHACGACCA